MLDTSRRLTRGREDEHCLTHGRVLVVDVLRNDEPNGSSHPVAGSESERRTRQLPFRYRLLRIEANRRRRDR